MIFEVAHLRMRVFQRYFMVDAASQGLIHPSIGRTDGWTQGVVSRCFTTARAEAPLFLQAAPSGGKTGRYS